MRARTLSGTGRIAASLTQREWLFLPGAIAVATGAAVTTNPRGTALVLAVGGTTLYVVGRQINAWWDLTVLLVAGVLALDYGFANLGFGAGGTPVPLTDLALVLLIACAVGPMKLVVPRTAPFLFAAAFVGIATVRLSFDYPRWGTDALRDYTLPLECGFLLIGYWSMALVGPTRWVRAFRWIFVVCLLYFALYPWRASLAAAGPSVGLQHAVPLLGNYWGAGTGAAAGLFFFALVRPFGGASLLLAAGFIPIMALLQSRGIYLAVPAALLIVGAVGLHYAPRVWRGMVLVVATGALGMVLLFAAAPEGRMGRLTPSFVVAQLSTLRGKEGPGAGSLQMRQQWAKDVARRVVEHPGGWLIGVGLGPDLSGGFRAPDDLAVRKPHDDYLEIFARMGALGLAAFLGMVISSALAITRGARLIPGLESRLMWWILATLFVYLIVAATQPLLAFPHGTVPLFALLGAGLQLAKTRPINNLPKEPECVGS